MAGYSATPLVKKLGLKNGMRALMIGVPQNLPEITAFAGVADCQQADAPEGLAGRRDRSSVHWFETSRGSLAANLSAIAGRLEADGQLWLSWPKKASRMPTDITEDVLRTVILPLGLVDVKVCAVDAVWSGLKFVWRRELRAHL